ncbi:MAG: SH3 domain-containing protein [Planctomycetota bacterium]
MVLVGMLALALIDWTALRDEGDRAYALGRYQEALVLYGKACEEGAPPHVLDVQLGNCLYRTGKIGAALYHYRLAELGAPRRACVRHNLAAALARLGRPTPGAEGLLETASGILRLCALSELVTGGFAVLIVLGFGVALGVAWPGSPIGRRIRRACILALVVLAVASGAHILRPRTVVVTAGGTALLSEPGGNGRVLARFAAGDEARSVGESGGWRRIALPNGLEGWVRASLVRELPPHDLAR